MTKFLSHPPSLNGVIPEILWQKLLVNKNQQLVELCHIQGQYHQLNTRYQFPFGYFKCIANDKSFFVKIIPKNKAITVKQGNIVALYLNNMIKVNCILDELSQENIVIDKRQSDVLIYPLLNTRFCDFSSFDLHNIAINLADFHNALLDYPNKEQVKKDSKARLAQLIDVWQKLKESSNDLPQSVNEILSRESYALLDVLEEGAQMIHGDLNVGNVLFNDEDEVYIIDFENTLYSHMSPIYDISYIIQRFILNIYKDNIDSKRLISNFIDTYLKHYKRSELITNILKNQPAKLQKILRASSVFCLLILSKQQAEFAVSVEKSEWDKFVTFYQSSILIEL